MMSESSTRTDTMSRKSFDEKLATMGTTRRKLLIGFIVLVLGIPLLFQIAFDEVGPIGWGLVIVFSVFYLILSVALYFRDTPTYREAITFGPTWLTPISIIWLTTCVLGPFFGYIVTEFPLWGPTTASWRGQYGVRVLLCIVLPLLSALPLLRHFIRSRARWVATPLILLITALPLLTGLNCLLDLKEGPILMECHHEASDFSNCTCQGISIDCDELKGQATSQLLFLPHTQRALEMVYPPGHRQQME